MSEYWDIYDRERRPTGRVHLRGTHLKSDEYHLVVDIVLVNRDGRLLIDRRSRHKRNCPGYWEFTSGSVLAGESSLSDAVRELKEELGIDADGRQLTLLGSGRARHRFIDTYLLLTDIDVERLTLQRSEVDQARLVTLSELDEICVKDDNWCKSTLFKYRSEIEAVVSSCLAKQ